jgi:large subunit ribosomal protein L24e
LDVIKERRAIRPEARQAARAEAIKVGKEKKKNDEAKKKADKAKVCDPVVCLGGVLTL